MNDRGLYQKYIITKRETGEEVKRPAFVLLPDRDPHARAALRAYADAVEADNPALAADLRSWMDSVEPQPKAAVPTKWGYFMRNWGIGTDQTPVLLSEWDTEAEALGDLRNSVGAYIANGRRVEALLPDEPDVYQVFSRHFPATQHYVAPIERPQAS
ncbi:MAG: hypothetical protein IPK17_38375 [Chloroflexi bacterium]|uniref:hypothetical protein n=1 Tax=Candidatus Flexifilum breve TaxID=3140694 RepID=UPI0031367396|nr:hypothetical protein [Chloroflexota bacterium]